MAKCWRCKDKGQMEISPMRTKCSTSVTVEGRDISPTAHPTGKSSMTLIASWVDSSRSVT